MPPGRNCYKTIKKTSENCIPCRGIYVHVEKDDVFKPVEKMEEFITILDTYKEYKLGYKAHIDTGNN
jgi:hypothetical protein